MRRIHFHIGDRKTGTTSLQSVLDSWDRSGAARAAGVLYPQAGRMNSDRINQRNLAHELDGDARFSPAHGAWEDLGRELAKAPDADHVLVSTESLENVDPKLLLEAVHRHLGGKIEPVILCYFRPHMSRLLASYTQNAKRGRFDGPLSEFVRKASHGRLGQSYERLEAWRTCFGKNFRLSLYQRDRLLNGDVVADILVRQMGLPVDLMASLPPPAVENRAPKPSTLDVLIALRRSLAGYGTTNGSLWPELEEALNQLQERLDRVAADEPTLQLDPETAELIHATCLSDARAIDAAFFADHPGVEAALDKGLDTARSASPWQDPYANVHAAWLEAVDWLVNGVSKRTRHEAAAAASDGHLRRARRKSGRPAQSA